MKENKIKKKRKKIFLLLLITGCLFAFSACSDNNQKNKNLGEISQNIISTPGRYTYRFSDYQDKIVTGTANGIDCYFSLQ